MLVVTLIYQVHQPAWQIFAMIMWFITKLYHIQSLLGTILEHVHSYPFIVVCKRKFNLSPNERNWAEITWFETHLLEMFQIAQISSVSVNLQLSLIKHADWNNISHQLANTTFILFDCAWILQLAMKYLGLLIVIMLNCQRYINDVSPRTNCAIDDCLITGAMLTKSIEQQMNWNWTDLSNLKHIARKNSLCTFI